MPKSDTFDVVRAVIITAGGLRDSSNPKAVGDGGLVGRDDNVISLAWQNS